MLTANVFFCTYTDNIKLSLSLFLVKININFDLIFIEYVLLILKLYSVDFLGKIPSSSNLLYFLRAFCLVTVKNNMWTTE